MRLCCKCTVRQTEGEGGRYYSYQLAQNWPVVNEWDNRAASEQLNGEHLLIRDLIKV